MPKTAATLNAALSTNYYTFRFTYLKKNGLIGSPNSWLIQVTEEERAIVKEHTRDNAVVRKQTVETSQYWEALKEPRLWLICIIPCAHNLQNGGLIAYSTVLVSGLGFNSNQSILFQIPSGAFNVIFVAIGVYINRKSKQIIFTAVCIGCLLLALLPNTAIKLLGYYLTWVQPGAYVMIFAMIGSNVSGYSKKIFYNGANMIAYTIGNFCDPLMLFASTKPAYVPTMYGYFGANVLNIIFAFCFCASFSRESTTWAFP